MLRAKHDSPAIVGRPTEFGELVPATLVVLCWLVMLIADGVAYALQMSWILLLGLPLGAWALLMRLQLDPDRLWMTVGPWRRWVDLAAIESVKWKMTGAGRSRGMIFIRDRMGRRVPIYVGRFTGIEEWGPVILDAATRTGANVDDKSRHLLEGAGAPRRRRELADDPGERPTR
jgi:hypothetical protein